ncbi:hypothetical protein TNCV_727301 [Trichonephila clavipes]|nr:hypothetical protein TNCV_727301 [Trichonephila clavipes]
MTVLGNRLDVKRHTPPVGDVSPSTSVVHNHNHALALSWYSSEMSPEEQRMRAGDKGGHEGCALAPRKEPEDEGLGDRSSIRLSSLCEA